MSEMLEYTIGVTLAILCGVFNNLGMIMQKKVVNEIPMEERDKDFMKKLIKNPVWLSGLLIALVFGSIFFMLAQAFIGPALVPGLMASGLIVLAIGSVKIIGEKLEKSEIIGIIIMIFGILLLGLSQLEITDEVVVERLKSPQIIFNLTIFSVLSIVLWIGIHYGSKKTGSNKGLIMAFSNGFPFVLSNFWISPLIALIGIIFSGNGNVTQLVIFIIACLFMIFANMIGIRETQEVFKFAPASKAVPVQQIPVQIAPILVYFIVFSLIPPLAYSMPLIISGVVLIVISGFLLGKRQAELDAIE